MLALTVGEGDAQESQVEEHTGPIAKAHVVDVGNVQDNQVADRMASISKAHAADVEDVEGTQEVEHMVPTVVVRAEDLKPEGSVDLEPWRLAPQAAEAMKIGAWPEDAPLSQGQSNYCT